jgi:C4-dicarboxylate-binding protein DctP
MLGVLGATLTLPMRTARAAEPMRISIETNPAHVRNKNTEAFIERVRKRLGDKVAPQLFPSAQLFRDRDIPRALRQGGAEMGQPGWWNLDGIAPDAALPSLPMFYGIEADLLHKIMEGPAGQAINRKIEERLRVKVLGDWWDLGPQHFYSTNKPLTDFDALKGLRIRHPGGSANAARISTLGANPILVPWPDVPLALSQKTVDGLITTHESANTAKLWDAGVRYCLEDFQSFNQYIPLVGETFWNKLSPADQAALTEAWQEGVPEERKQAAAAQKEARDILTQNNIQIVTPPAAAIAETRKKLMATQDKIVSDIGMDRDLVASVLQEIRGAGFDV